MKYPPGFPEDLHPPVDRALAEAELRFRAGAQNTPDDDDNAFQGLALGLTYFIVQMPWLTVLPYANVALWTAAALYLLLYRNKPRRRLINHQGPTEMNAV